MKKILSILCMIASINCFGMKQWAGREYLQHALKALQNREHAKKIEVNGGRDIFELRNIGDERIDRLGVEIDISGNWSKLCIFPGGQYYRRLITFYPEDLKSDKYKGLAELGDRVILKVAQTSKEVSKLIAEQKKKNWEDLSKENIEAIHEDIGLARGLIFSKGFVLNIRVGKVVFVPKSFVA